MANKILPATFGLILTTLGGAVSAAVSSEEAARLGGPVLTEFGAERAGNEDGSIPPYTGGLGMAPSGSGTAARLVDPFPDEEPLFRITRDNMGEHEQYLTAGAVATMQQYPNFYIDVYPTHRTASYPEWVLENTVRNATTAELTGRVTGDGVKNAHGGIPFPIPQNGHEVLWNFFLKWEPARWRFRNDSWLVTPGHKTLLGNFTVDVGNAYYDNTRSSASDVYYRRWLNIGNAPSSQVGYNLLIQYSMDYSEADQLNWVYTPGQRRVRVAPEFTYDTPAANFGGALIYDEVGMYAGRPDRFEFHLKGKREMYVPYNVTKPNQSGVSSERFHTPNFPNPELVRWEKHRVWVVEATLKEGRRHIMPKRVFYFDEDSWNLLATDGYDRSGKLYRVGFGLPFQVLDEEQSFQYAISYFLLDLTRGVYFSTWIGPNNNFVEPLDERFDPGMFTPQGLTARGIR